MDRDEVEVHKLAEKERGQYTAILTEQTWSIMDLLYGFRRSFSCGIQRVVPSGQDGSILPARVANHIARFGSSCPLAERAIIIKCLNTETKLISLVACGSGRISRKTSDSRKYVCVFRPITDYTDNLMNQSKLKANTCSQHKARENECERVTTGLEDKVPRLSVFFFFFRA